MEGWVPMGRFARSLLLVVLATTLARADVFTLKDGSTLEGTVTGSDGDAYLVKLASGENRRILKADVQKREYKEATAAAPATTPAATPVAPSVGETTEQRLEALKKAAREGLSARARLTVGARELATYYPLKVEGGYALANTPKKIEIDQCTFQDRSVDEVAHELWDKRKKGADERFRALKAVAATVCWAEAEVLSSSPSGRETEAVIEYRSVVLKGKTRFKLTDAPAAHAILKLAVVLLVRQDEGTQFLQGQMGETISVWPMDFVPLAAEITTGTRTPRTVAADMAMRVGERTLSDAVKQWYDWRVKIRCPACKSTKKCVCPGCSGAGGIWKPFIDAGIGGAGTSMQWYVCGRCQGTGFHVCQACKDGLDEQILKDSLKRFGTYGKYLGGYLVEGQKIVVDADGKAGTVTTFVREKPDDQPKPETLRWTVDEKTGQWKPAERP